MCEQCGPADGAVEEGRENLRMVGPSRRRLLLGLGAGLGGR